MRGSWQGTCAGCGVGAAMNPRQFLKPGDRVRVAISPHDPGRGRIVEIVNKEN